MNYVSVSCHTMIKSVWRWPGMKKGSEDREVFSQVRESTASS